MSFVLNLANALHKARHATGGPDAIAPADIGAETAGAAAAAQAAAAADATGKVAAVTVTTLGAITPAGVDTKITTERGTERAYQSSTYGRPGLSSAVLLGDSITAGNGGPGPYTSSAVITDSKGYFTVANIILGHRVQVLSNAGKAGDTATGMIARYAADVTPHAPGWVILLAGSNDVSTGRTAAQIIGDLGTLIANTAALGARTLLCTILPRDALTAPQAAVLSAVNDWIRSAPNTLRGVVVADTYAAFADGASVVCAPLAGNLLDGLHPNALGGSKLGKVIAAALTSFVPATNPLTLGDPSNLLINGAMAGTGTTIPTGWSQGGTAPTYSYVPRTDGIAGTWCQIVVPAGGQTFLQQNVMLSAALAIGDNYYAAMEYQTSAVDAAAGANTQSGPTLEIQSYNGSAFSDAAWDNYWDTGYINALVPESGVLQTPNAVVPAGGILVQPVIYLKGGGTYRLGRGTLRKAT